MASTFAIDLSDDDEKVIDEFRQFLEKRISDPDEVTRVISEFRSSTLPQIIRFRALMSSGSNVDFSSNFDTSAGSVTVALNSSPKSLVSRIAKLFGR